MHGCPLGQMPFKSATLACYGCLRRQGLIADNLSYSPHHTPHPLFPLPRPPTHGSTTDSAPPPLSPNLSSRTNGMRGTINGTVRNCDDIVDGIFSPCASASSFDARHLGTLFTLATDDASFP